MRFVIPLLIGLMVFSPVAWAQPASQPTSQPALKKLPKGQQVEVKKEQLRAYTLEEFKVLLHIYTDYRSWGVQLPKVKLQVDSLTQLSKNQAHQLSLRAEEVKVYQGERKLLTEKYLKENKLRHQCENKPNFGSWIAWGSAALMGIVAAVLAGIVIADKD